MAATTEMLQNSDNDLSSASDAIDQMISMSIANHNPDPNNPNSDKSTVEQTNINRQNCSPRLVWKNMYYCTGLPIVLIGAYYAIVFLFRRSF